MPRRIEVVNAKQQPNCLALKGLESVFGYNFTGETDILLAYSKAARTQFPEICSAAAIDLKKGEVNPLDKKHCISADALLR